MLFCGVDFVTIQDVEKIYGINSNRVSHWFQRGRITGYRYYGYGVPIEERLTTSPMCRGKLYKRMYRKEDVEKILSGQS